MAEGVLLSPLELVLGRPLGAERNAPPLPDVQPGTSALAVLEECLRQGLANPPCLVMFSGGRDSSGILAIAVGVARRYGLELPIPLTFRFPGIAESEEDEWQDVVVRHLGIGHWERRSVSDEWDLLGPFATKVLLRHGPIWPPNAFALAAAAEVAAGGSVVTGSFGDELFQPDSQLLRYRAALDRKDRLRARDLMRVGLVLSPRPLRRFVARQRFVRDHHVPPWVSPGLRPHARNMIANDLARLHLRWDTAIRAAWGSRYTQVVRRVLHLLAADENIRLIAPFGDPRFRVAFARLGAARGFRSRSAAMQTLFDGLLPTPVIQRSSKAIFNGVFWNRHSYEFLRDWRGDGLDPQLVDIDVLRRVWSWEPNMPGRPDSKSATLLQAAWLATVGHITPVSRADR